LYPSILPVYAAKCPGPKPPKGVGFTDPLSGTLKLGLIVISMKRSISDAAAAAFAIQFYGAVASGQSVKSAFEQGVVAVEATSINEASTPQLFCPKGVDPSKLILT
jgi:hypothetical protein